MCDACHQKAQDIAKLSRYFREKARETTLEYYTDIMLKTADELDELSRYYAQQCRCADQR